MKHAKRISYIVVLVLSVFSFIQPVLAQNKRTNGTGSSVNAKPHSAELESQFKSVRRRVSAYTKCFMSQAGCSRARNSTLVAAIVGLLYLVGRKKRREGEQVQEELAKSKEESARKLEKLRRSSRGKEKMVD